MDAGRGVRGREGPRSRAGLTAESRFADRAAASVR
jgi:hypothetical protein